MTGGTNRAVRAAVFRPDDERLAEAVELLDSLGADPVRAPRRGH